MNVGCDRPWLTFALGRHDCERAMCDNAKGFCVIMIRCTDYGQLTGVCLSREFEERVSV